MSAPAPIPKPIPAPGSTVIPPQRKRKVKPQPPTRRGNAGGARGSGAGGMNTGRPAGAAPKKPKVSTPWNPLTSPMQSHDEIVRLAKQYADADIRELLGGLQNPNAVRADVRALTSAGVGLMNRGNQQFDAAAAGAPDEFRRALGANGQAAGATGAAIAAGGPQVAQPAGAGGLMGAMGATMGAALQGAPNALAARGSLEEGARLKAIADQRAGILSKQPALRAEYLQRLEQRALELAIARDNSGLAHQQFAQGVTEFGVNANLDNRQFGLQQDQLAAQVAQDQASNTLRAAEFQQRQAEAAAVAAQKNTALTPAQKDAAKQKAVVAKRRADLIRSVGAKIDSDEKAGTDSATGYSYTYTMNVPTLKENSTTGKWSTVWTQLPVTVDGGEDAGAAALRARQEAYNRSYNDQLSAINDALRPPPLSDGATVLPGSTRKQTSSTRTPTYSQSQRYYRAVHYLTSRGIGPARARRAVAEYMGWSPSISGDGPPAGSTPSGP